MYLDSLSEGGQRFGREETHATGSEVSGGKKDFRLFSERAKYQWIRGNGIFNVSWNREDEERTGHEGRQARDARSSNQPGNFPAIGKQ